KGTIWVFFSDGEIYYLSKGSSTFHFFSKGIEDGVRSVLIDNNLIWIGYESNGLLCLNIDGTRKFHFKANNRPPEKIPNNQVRSIIKAENEQIWVGTYNGIVVIENFKVVSVIHPDKYSELPNHSIWSLFKDSRENIWIGTWLGGLCFHSRYNNSFFHYNQSTPGSSLSYSVVSSFVRKDGSQVVIVGTEDGNLNYYNPETNKFTQKPVTIRGVKAENIKSMAYDIYGTLWIGTYGHGVFYQKKSSNDFTQLVLPFATGIQALDLCTTQEGIWVSNYPLGVYFYHFEMQTFKQYRHNPLDINSISDGNVHHIIQDMDGNMWFATRNGLNLLENGSEQFVHFFHQENNKESISSNLIFTIHEDENRHLWLGTNGQGLDKFNPKTAIAEHYTTANGLPGNEILSILEDSDKKLWLATNGGLCVFDPSTEQVRSFIIGTGIENNSFNPNAAMAHANGELYFGGTNGFIRFQPEEISFNPVSPTTIITHFYIHNTEILPEDENGILNDVIRKTESVSLNYKQNSLGFRFVTNNFINPGKNRFKYRLVEFDDTWTETDYNGRATFTNVPPGNYIFEVKAANNDGVWNESPTQLAIEIIPPVWKRWYAYLIYVLAIIFIIHYFRQQLINKQKLKNEIELEKVKRENEENLHQMKLQFFTNISHEFRTPLTLIQGPIERLMNNEKDKADSKKQLTHIKNNTDRLLRLVNQFLDFRKIDSGKILLNPVNADIIAFCRNIYNCFEEHAQHRSFDFTFKSDVSSLKMDFDPDKMDKILFNILSNAFKFSKDGGKIEMEIRYYKIDETQIFQNTFILGEEILGEWVEIKISDSGKGIPEENLTKIFDRYYQIDGSSKIGTGIGLALTKNYILLHGGKLVVRTTENKGSSFSVFIPQTQPGLKEEQNSQNSNYFVKENYNVEIQNNSDLTETENGDNQNEDALVLIVEDNFELLNYLGDLLQENFRVSKARNGKQALEQIHSIFPDLIISDIMMPEMDGIELCKFTKNDIRTSHIPIILLTALDTVKDRISGLHSGADAYISKPFDDKLLLVQANNLLESRKRLRESFSSEHDDWEEKFNSFDLDKKLLIKAIKVTESNMTNVDFSVEDLAHNLNLSRTHLHRKLKSLTNQSATEFIRSIRLKKAVQLMKEGNHKVNEIGYTVGFNSHNYFTKSFKKQFGMSPSDFIRKNFGEM
ncbi:MAG: hybrid sensor histidine kinase/response regulator, partial [Bacteroidetes bacterium]